MSKLNMPGLGDKFPRLEVETSNGNFVIPDHYEGKWFVLFSHPGDFTPVCTTEFESFAMSEKEFSDINTELIGISLDSVEEHKEWIKWVNENAPAKINFPVIGGDSSKLVANELGMVHEASGNASVRAVFIVDPAGLLRLMMYYPMTIGRNISEIVRSVKALQLHDKSQVSTPADWPNNAWLGENQVIVSMPRTEEQEKAYSDAEKAGELTRKAPWLSYKTLK